MVPEQILHTIEKFRMVQPGQRIAVGCSGGPDSTALLLLLHELSNRLGCVLSVAHFNHRLRAEQSEADEAFAHSLAERLQAPFHVAGTDVRSAARSARVNLEAKARQLRYQFLFSLLETGQADRVAVGHTADDQAETVLHRLLRGSGTRGLAGIYPVVEGKLVRPLLAVRRAALLEWLAARQEPWREDESNRDVGLLRNRIRHEILPRLAQLNPRIVELLFDTAEIARGEEAFWQDYLAPFVERIVSQEGEKVIVDIDRLRQTPLAVARRVLRSAVAGAAGATQGCGYWSPAPAVAFAQIDRLLTMAHEGQSGSLMTLPRNLAAKKEFQHLILRKAGPARETEGGFCYQVQVPGAVEVPEIGSRFVFELIPLGEGGARYNKRGGFLDSRFAKAPLILRNWRAGDTFLAGGQENPRKLKRFFLAQRVSLSERRRWPVVVGEGQIIWARGVEVGAFCSAPPGSQQAIRIQEGRL